MTDKELILKKTARRRLVGAITLVILMLLVLPFVLKDRVADLAQEEVKVTVINEEAPELIEPSPAIAATDPAESAESTTPMSTSEPAASINPSDNKAEAVEAGMTPEPVVKNEGVADKTAASTTSQPSTLANSTPKVMPETSANPSAKKPSSNATEAINSLPSTSSNVAAESVSSTTKNQALSKQPSKPADLGKTKVDVAKKTTTLADATPEKKPAISDKKTTSKKSGTFFVQFGVFSDPKNLESLRQKLAQNGIESVVEPVGQRQFKLRSQPYSQRSDAQTAQQQMQAMGVNGIVVSK